MKFRAHVRILPRPGLLDPQGQVIAHALTELDFSEASAVRVGKAIEVDLEAVDAAAATRRVRAMCETLLANPVTEDFRIEVESRS